MRNRLIAVIVLASLGGYAVPLPLLTAGQAAAMPATASHSSDKTEHSCCPDLHPRMISIVLLTMDPATMPCGGQHPCCAKRAPQNLPSLPAANRRTTTDRSAITVASAQHQGRSPSMVLTPWVGHIFERYRLKTTVLRI